MNRIDTMIKRIRDNGIKATHMGMTLNAEFLLINGETIHMDNPIVEGEAASGGFSIYALDRSGNRPAQVMINPSAIASVKFTMSHKDGI